MVYQLFFPHHTVTSLTLICACSQEHEWVQIDWFDLYRAEASANDRCQLDVSGSVFHSFGRFVQNGPLFYRFDSGTMAGTHFHVSFHSTVSKKCQKLILIFNLDFKTPGNVFHVASNTNYSLSFSHWNILIIFKKNPDNNLIILKMPRFFKIFTAKSQI